LSACEYVSVSEKEEERLQLENSRLRRLLVQAGLDAAASDSINKVQKALIVEMHHRVKNLLAMVLSITSRTLQTSSNLASAEKAIFERIHTLSRTYDLLLNQGELEASPLKDILEHAVEAFNQAGQIVISVPHLIIPASLAIPLSLVFNELCTNAVKYGALSDGKGRVHLKGTVEGSPDAILCLAWTESGGPPVSPPQTSGFGSQMISVAV